jgi:hypothetical protein
MFAACGPMFLSAVLTASCQNRKVYPVSSTVLMVRSSVLLTVIDPVHSAQSAIPGIFQKNVPAPTGLELSVMVTEFAVLRKYAV